MRWLRWRRNGELDKARKAAEASTRRRAEVESQTPLVKAEVEPIRRASRENNLAPLIMRALGVSE